MWESFTNEIEKRRYSQPENCYENLHVGNTKEGKHNTPSMRRDGQATRLCPPTGDATGKRNKKTNTNEHIEKRRKERNKHPEQITNTCIGRDIQGAGDKYPSSRRDGNATGSCPPEDMREAKKYDEGGDNVSLFLKSKTTAAVCVQHL